MIDSNIQDHFQDDGIQNRDFYAKMRQCMGKLAEALSAYVIFVDTQEVTDVEDLEKSLETLFDAYLAAGKVVDTALDEVEQVTGNRNYGNDGWSPLRPKPLTVGTLKEIAESEAMITRFNAEAERVRRVERAAVAVQDTIKAEIFKIMPKYVWIRHGNLHFGINTGTWGGYTIHLHVRKLGEELFKLDHRTYYD